MFQKQLRKSIMPRLSCCLVLAFAAMSFIHTAHAVAAPAPIPTEELIQICDLVIEGDILSVRRFSDEYGGYLAKVKVTKTVKGDSKAGEIVSVPFAPASGALGDSGIAIFAGQQLRLFILIEQGHYRLYPHNEAEILQDVPEEQQRLPKTVADVIYAPGYKPAIEPVPSRRRLFFRRWR